MKQLLKISVLAAVLGMTACSTMYFERTGSHVAAPENSEWHHDGILRLVEFSSPVDLSQVCGGKEWKTVMVQRSFLNGLAAMFTSHWYDPWTVSYQCGSESARGTGIGAGTGEKMK